MGRWGWLLATLWLAGCAQTSSRTVEVACPDVVAGCVLPDRAGEVRFERRPSAMARFGMAVTLNGPGEPQAYFEMQGMAMGLNRYRLLPDGPGRWRAEVMLPACVQGRSDWVLKLEVRNVTYAVPFTSVR